MMKKYLCSALAVAALTLHPAVEAFAQDKSDKEKSKNKLGEYDEIIIKQKDTDKSGKVTIEIKDGEVMVNGKPMDKYDDDNISVRRRSATRLSLASPASPFRNGTSVWTVDGEDRALLGVTTENEEGGAKVVSVAENSAAAKAGLKRGDVIVKVEDQSISSPDDLMKAVSKQKPEDKVIITFKRDGKENKATATLGKREVQVFGRGNTVLPTVPSMENFNFDFDLHGDQGRSFYAMGRPRIGIRAQDTEDGKGVKVLSVDDESLAEKAGIKEDDIITEFDGKNVNSADELVEASRAAREKSSMTVKLNREGKSQVVELKIPKKLKTANL